MFLLYNYIRWVINIKCAGARSNASMTFLEKFKSKMGDLPIRELILVSLRALKEATSEPLTEATCEVAVVGIGMSFHLLAEDELKNILAEML